MKYTEAVVLIAFLLITTSEARHKRKVKRFGESLTSLPYLPNQQPSFSFDNGITIPKSNIPFAPSLINTIPSNDDNSQEIPLGPLVQSDSEKVDGDVHLKDLLSFIRKANIPEDPFSSTDTTDLLPSSREPQTAFNMVPEGIQRRFTVPGIQEMHSLGFMPQRKRYFMQQNALPVDRLTTPFSFQSLAYERKNIIPHGPSLNQKKSIIRTPVNIAQTVQKSSIPRPAQIVDPYEGLRQAIIKKAATDTKPIKTKRNLFKKSIIPRSSTGSSHKGDPYEHLRRAISAKEEELHEQDTLYRGKKGQISNAVEKETSLPQATQMKATYPYNFEQERKADIPGITIEHETFSRNTNDKNIETVRKDRIPEGDKTNESAVGDANNEPESKRSIFTQEPFTNTRRSSVIPINGQIETMQQEALNGPDQQDPLSTTNAQLAIDSQFVTKSYIPEQQPQQINQAYTAPISMYMTSNEQPEEQLRSAIISSQDATDEMQKTNTTLPSGMELERTKIQREMHLIGQLQNMKKSNIPHPLTYDVRSNILTQGFQYPNRQTNQPMWNGLPENLNSYQYPGAPQITQENAEVKFEERKSNIPVLHDSTPLVLHVHPAEGIANFMSPKQSIDPSPQLIMKKSNIPDQVVDSTNGLYKAADFTEPSSTMLPHQMNFEEEAPVKKSETSNQESYLVMTSTNEKKSTIPTYSNLYNQNGQLVNEEDNQQLQPSNQVVSDTEEKAEVKKDVIPAVVPDSYPLHLRKLPPS